MSSYTEDLAEVANAFEDFPHEYVLVGGAVLPLLLTDQIVSARPTHDVDVVVRVETTVEYHNLQKWLRNNGFAHVEDGPICRWETKGKLVDVMPTDKDVLGFSNRWNETALESAQTHKLTDDLSIPVIAPPTFIASKQEAFRNRGESNFYGSTDLEDIITILDGRPEVVDELKSASKPLQSYVAGVFEDWCKRREFQSALPGHLQHASSSSGRVAVIEERIERIIEGAASTNDDTN